MRFLMFLALLVMPSLAAAQIVSPLNGATAAQVQAASDAAAAAAVVAQNAADAAAAKCNPMVAVPRSEVVGGTAGSGQNCILINAAASRISRTDTFTVAGSSGLVTVVWDNPLPTTTSSGVAYGSYPVLFTAIAASGTAVAKWKLIDGTATNTGFQAQCSQQVSTLNFTLAALTAAALTGLQLPLDTWCPAGTKVFALQLPSAK